MKTDANWCVRIGALALVLIVVLAAFSCGSNGGFTLDPSGSGRSTANSAANEVTKSAGLIPAIPESAIGSLPAWQRELLSDAGWNQPYITPPAGTPVETPTRESLLSGTAAAMTRGVKLDPRFAEGGAKGASWTGDAPPFPQAIFRAEYSGVAPGGTPTFGCNTNGSNTSAAGNAIEDLIVDTANNNPLPTYSLCYVREGLCTPNYFNTVAGVNKGASTAVYQAYCSINTGAFDPADPPDTAQVAEISYRSSLVPNGAPGQPCNAEAFVVRDYFWRVFNANLDAIPTGSTPLYNVFIAPSAKSAGPYDSLAKTTGEYQPFYFGSMGNCYGGAWIIGLTASDSDCDTFKDYFDPVSENYVSPGYWYRPIYGVLLKRWLDMAPAANQGWNTELGWPVYGPVAYANGAMQLNSKGTYYQWGMWFEMGFIWWVDYDQATNPTVPDEAQAYRFTGDNVYCWGEDDELIKIAPTVFYGNAGPLGVSVTVDAYRNLPTDDWAPVEQNDTGSEYHVSLPSDDGMAVVTLKMHAQGYGGTPNVNCLYKTYVWAFRDGTIQPPGTGYSAAQMTAVHTYGDMAVNKENTYVVRVQIQDEVGFAYGDSLPIVMGHGAGGGGGGEVLVIRDDAPTYNTYNTNFNALLADLDDRGVLYTVQNFTPTIANDFIAGTYKVALWYRGGPGAVGETNYTTAWTAQEEANFNQLLPKKMLLIGQAQGSVSTTWSYSYWGWDSDPDSQFCQRVNGALMTHVTDQNMGLMSNEFNGVFGWLYVMWGGEMGTGKSNTRGPQRLGLPGVWGASAAERNLLSGSSGKLPQTMQWATGGTDVLQFCCRGWYPPFGGSYINSGWICGMLANPSGSGGWDDGNYGAANLSYGNSTSGGSTWQTPGPGKFWCWGMPYAKLTVTGSAPAGMTRAEMLQNTLSWLDGTLTFGAAGAGGASGWSPYDGNPEIIQVMPGYWTQTPPLFVKGAVVQPGIGYPDTTGTDVFKTNYTNLAGQRYLSTTQAGNNGANCNDIDGQYPWYAYITTTNGAVETSADTTVVPPIKATDDTVAIRGLLVNDTDGNWSRYTPPVGQMPNCLLNLQGANGPTPLVAGYFTSLAGNTGDEIYANYGTGPVALSWNNQYKLECEAIAHWPETLMYGTNPAVLYWSMFPGHRMFVPGTGTYFTDSAGGWETFRKVLDIDPTVAVAGRTGSTWNSANFAYTNVLAQGRVVQFDYRSINTWNGDMNRDNDGNLLADAVADKFPIRCRLFTNYGSYIDSDPGTAGNQPYVWPNNEQPTSTYVEGGCYVVDTGLPVYRVRISTNGNPFVSGITGNYNVQLPFILKFGTPNYPVQVDADYNGTWGSAPTGRVFNVTGYDNSTTGAKTGTANITGMPDGNYTFAIRVIDGAGDTSTAVYPIAVALFPAEIFKETFEGGAQTAANSDLTWTISGPQGAYGYDWANQTGAAPFLGYSAHGGTRYVRWNTTTQNVGYMARRWAQTGPYTIVPTTFYRLELYTNGDTSFLWDYYYMCGLRAQLSYNGSTWWDIPTTVMHYDYDGGWMVTPAWYHTALGMGTWTRHAYNFTSGASNSQIWFRYGMETDRYNYCDYDTANYPNRGGPGLDDIRLYPPPPPPPPIWTETFESGMGAWALNYANGVTFVQASGAAGGGNSPSGAQGGTYYCKTTPRNYPDGSYTRYTTGPITCAANTGYDLTFYTAGYTEGSWDCLMVGYSFNNSTWTWTGPDNVYGHDYAMYQGYADGTLGATTWRQQTASITTGAGQTQIWIRIGFESDGSVNYDGPTLDTMALGAS
jgi:hypothetical protein